MAVSICYWHALETGRLLLAEYKCGATAQWWVVASLLAPLETLYWHLSLSLPYNFDQGDLREA